MGRKLSQEEALTLFLKNHLRPIEEFKDVHSRWKSECLSCYRIVEPTYNNVKRRGKGCKFCSLVERSNKRKTDPIEAVKKMELAGLHPLEEYRNALSRWKCECVSCGRIVTPTLNSINNGSSGCKYCGHKRGGVKNRISEQSALEIMMLNNLKPLVPYVNNRTPWLSLCLQCNREVKPRLSGISNGQGGCRYCGGNALDNKEIDEKMKAIKLQPLVPYPGAHKKWKCLCLRCDRVVYPFFVYINSKDSKGCNYCSKTKVDEEEAKRIMKSAMLQPLVPYPGAHKKWKCKCIACGTIVFPAYHSIRSGQGGCPSCADSGFDPSKDGYLYFITHSDWEMFQIGITNFPDDRLKNHKKLGWEILELRGPMDGHLTQQWETAILRMLKAKGADLSNEKIAGKFDGYSEAWTKATFSVDSIKELMRLTDEFEAGQEKKQRRKLKDAN